MAWSRPAGHLFTFFAWSLLYMLCTLQAFAQPLLTVPYSLEDGLVQSQVTEIYQDSKGYMWFGTLGGVSRFDGLKFTNYTIADGLTSNRISGLAEDHEGRIWIGTPKGIQVLDGSSVIHITTKDGLMDNEVNGLLSLPSGDIWIASRSGLTFYDGDSFSHITEVDGLVSPFVVSMTQDSEGNLWVGTLGGACLLKNREATCYSTHEGLPHNTVSTLLVDQRGRVWAGTLGGIALLLPGEENGRFITLDYLPNQQVSALLQDKTGAIWISNRQGFYRIDQKMNVTDQWDDGEWIGAALYQDREGTVWGGTFGRGVIQFRPTAFTHKNFVLDLPEDVFLSIFQDNDGVVWVGTLRNGLYRITDNQVEHYNPKDTPFLNHIRSIRRGPDSTLWFGTSRGVIRYDASGFRHFSNKDGLPYTFSVLPDSNGVTWAGNFAGLHKIHSDSLSPVPLPISKKSRMVHTLERIDSRIWIGAEEGLMYLEGDSVYLAQSLQGIPIISIAWDQSNTLWLGTLGNGVYQYDPVRDLVTDSITTQDGLNSGSVYFAKFDNHNKLWVGTNKGINKIRINPEASGNIKSVKTFGQKDGIVGVETNKNTAMIDYEGRFWFGTLKGLMQYDAADEPVNNHPPPVYLTEAQLYLETLAKGDTLEQNTLVLMHNDNHLTFHYLGISFIAPEHVTYQYQLRGFDKGWSPITSNRFVTYSNLPPGDYTFEVRARNSDGIWSLQPASATFSITPPYWQTNWFRGLSAAGILLLVIGIVQIRTYTINKRSNQLQVMVKERTLELETTHTALLEAREDALQAAKTRSAFLSTMTHELRTPMNGIMGMAQLLNFTELDEEQVDYSDTILESSTAMLDMIENLLTFADLAAGQRVLQEEVFSIYRLIQESIESISPQAKIKKLDVLSYISPALASEIKADREHIRQIIKHLLSNAVKFTEQGLIYLEVNKRAKRVGNEVSHELVISIHDTGIGIEKTRLEEIFDSFTQLDMTATRSFEGTGIGLALARNMTALLDGNLHAESKPGVGSSFYFSLPLHEVHQQSVPKKTSLSPLSGKRVMIILQSERERRRLALVCKSLEMSPELAQPSALFGAMEGFDLVLSETRLENKSVHWQNVNHVGQASDAYTGEGVQGIVIEADIEAPLLVSALRQTVAAGSAPQRSDFHNDFGNPMQNG